MAPRPKQYYSLYYERGNPSNLPYIFAIFDPPRLVIVMTPVKYGGDVFNEIFANLWFVVPYTLNNSPFKFAVLFPCNSLSVKPFVPGTWVFPRNHWIFFPRNHHHETPFERCQILLAVRCILRHRRGKKSRRKSRRQPWRSRQGSRKKEPFIAWNPPCFLFGSWGVSWNR